MLSFKDLLVTPFTELLRRGGTSLHRGGPHWPEFDRQTEARHCRRGKPVDDQPLSTQEVLMLDGPFAWGGPVFDHFGHQIAEFGMRLGATLQIWPEAVFLHAGLESLAIGSLDRTPAHFQSMLAWLGIPPDRVRLIDRPTRVRELVVVPQAEQLQGPGPSPAHLDWLDELTARRLGKIVKNGVVYVSRSTMPTRFAAESYLDEALSGLGVLAIWPETLPLQEQLRTYASARHLIFAEGSAINGARLMGRALGEVTVLRRRSRSQIAPIALHALQPRAQSLRYIEALRGVVHGVNHRGVPEIWSGITVLDDDVLVEELESLGIPLKARWRSRDFAARRDADVRQWLKARKDSGVDSGIPVSAASIEHSLRAAGLGHLTDLM